MNIEQGRDNLVTLMACIYLEELVSMWCGGVEGQGRRRHGVELLNF